MNVIKLEDINKTFVDAGFNEISDQAPNFSTDYVAYIWQREEDSIEKLKLLRKHKIITDHDVHHYLVANIDGQNVDEIYEKSALVQILASEERDGTLFYSDSEDIYNTCWDPYIEFIRNTTLIGGEIDQNQFLPMVFTGERQEFEIFDYLIENFEFSNEALLKCASWLIQNRYTNSEKGKIAFKKLQEKGLNAYQTYNDGLDFSEYESFLRLTFICAPIICKELLEVKQCKEIVNTFSWITMLKETYIEDSHIEVIKQLIIDGYEIPLEEISEYLEKKHADYAETIRNLM